MSICHPYLSLTKASELKIYAHIIAKFKFIDLEKNQIVDTKINKKNLGMSTNCIGHGGEGFGFR